MYPLHIPFSKLVFFLFWPSKFWTFKLKFYLLQDDYSHIQNLVSPLKTQKSINL